MALTTLKLEVAEYKDVPVTFDEVCTLVEQIEGVHFRDLFDRLPQRAKSGAEALEAVLALARAPAADPT